MSRKTAVPKENNIDISADSIRRSRDRVWEHRLVWLLLIAILGLWCYFSIMGRVDGKLTQEIVKLLRKEFPAHFVTVERAHFLAGKSITIEGIRIAKQTDSGLRDVVRCGRIVCSGPIEMIGLVQGQIPVQHVEANDVELCVWPTSEGKFSLQELSSSKPLSDNLPVIDIRSGLIRLGGETGRDEREIILHDLRGHAELAPRMVDGRVMPLSANVYASVSSSYFNNVTVHGAINQDKTSWRAAGKVTKLAFSQRLIGQLPARLQQYFVHAAGFSGELDGDFSAGSDQGKIQYMAQAKIADGRLMHPKVPYPLEALSGELFLTNGLMQLRKFHATSGPTSVALECDMRGFVTGAPITAVITVQDLSLDQRLYQALPVPLQDIWQKMGVSGGLVDAQAKLGFDGNRWIPNVVVRAKNAGIEPEFFPYPIRNLTGDFLYENDAIVAKSLVAMAGNQEINGALSLVRAQPRWLMDLKLAANGPITIDERLLKALSARGAPESSLQKFVLSLHPTGTVHLKQGRFLRQANQPDTLSRSLELIFSECSIKYDGFRYPIDDIQGAATIDNDRLLLKDFVGRNDGARIKASGVCQSRNSNLESMDLLFDAYDVSLDEELQRALPRNVRGLWDQLRPSGVIDNVQMNISRTRGDVPLDMRVAITEKGEFGVRTGGAVSIRPESLPYQINDVACNIIYQPGHIDIKSLSGKHESSRLFTNGQCSLHPDGTWDGIVTWEDLTRLHVDQSLLACLPPYLKDPLAKLDFRGPVNITGTTRVTSPTSTQSIVREWDLDLQFEDGRLGAGIASGIRGAISLRGENTPTGPKAFGRLNLDALAIKDFAVTRVDGPFAFNQREILFGRDAVAWMQSNDMLSVPSISKEEASKDGAVSTAVFQSWIQRAPDNSVQQASHRGPIRDALSHRIDSMGRLPNVPPPNPNAVRLNTTDIPLDVMESDIRARALSGTVFVSGIESLDSQQRSKYRLRLAKADLQGMLVDIGEAATQARGELSIQCDLTGALSNTASLEGHGKAWLRDANLYELPAMIRLFRLLSVSPSQGAFDSGDVEFGVDGDRLPIHELVLDGDLVSMRGSGWVNLRRELHLDLLANVGRRSLLGTVVGPLSSSKAAALWQIEVNGTASDPQIRRPISIMNSIDKVRHENKEE
jgi:AsmA-like C-terminal region